MKFLLRGFVYLAAAASLRGGTVIIDDFSFPQVSGSGPGEVSSSSIFGGYRSIGANGFVRFVLIDGMFSPSGDTSGGASVSIGAGTFSFSKTALTGSAYASYGGRAFTDGDRIGDLNLNISGAPDSLAEPVLLLGYAPEPLDRTISLFLASDVDYGSAYDLRLPGGTNELILDLRQEAPFGVWAAGGVNFGEIDEILLGYRNGNPAGAVALNTLAFVPEPSASALLVLAWVAAGLRLRPGKRDAAGTPLV